MAVYYSITCPHCGKVVESGKNRTKEYGSPLRTCKFCNKKYIDKNYIEVGLMSLKELDKPQINWWHYFLVFLEYLLLT